MSAAATHVQRPSAGGEPGLSQVEQQIVDIFELDPKEFQARLDGTAVPGGATHEPLPPPGAEPRPTALERRDLHEPGSFERDFWDEVSKLEEQLTAAGARGDVAQTAIALAATHFSLVQSGEYPDGRNEGGGGSNQGGTQGAESTPGLAAAASEIPGGPQLTMATDGAAALVASRAQLENRAQRAVTVAQGLTGSALKAAGGGKG